MYRAWNVRGIVCAALLTGFLQGCEFSGGPLDGVVLDKDTNRPIAGVLVVARWYGNWSKLAGESSSACYHVESTRTDANGQYHIRRWTRESRLEDFRFSSAGQAVTFYKPDYIDVSNGSAVIAHMQRFAGTNQEYFDRVLDQKKWLCNQAGDSSNQLYRVFKAGAADARSKAVTAEQVSKALFLTRMMQESLVDTSKPTSSDGGVLMNIYSKDNLPAEE